MSHVVEVGFTGDPRTVVTKAKAAAERYGATFSGDHVAGTFAGNGIEGRYRFGNTVVVVTIDKKPDIAPWPMVESAIKGFFESASEPETAKGPQRSDRADKIIKKYVLYASGAGLIPVPLADVAAVTAVQVTMLQELTKLYDSELTEPVLQNFVTALTGGMLARIGASAVKAIPGLGTLLGGASMSIMSGASTYAVARVAKNHLEGGGSLASVDLAKAKREYGDAYDQGKEYVTTLKQQTDDSDVIAKLERLGELRAKGVLTEEEFQDQKTRLLQRTR